MPRWTMAMAGGALAFAVAAAPAAAQTSTRYSPWQGSQDAGQTDSLIHNLQSLIDEADRAKAADPRFLQDLRDVIADYQKGGGGNTGTAATAAMVNLLRDDFQDGDYTANPAWTVSAGQWNVDGGRGLHSTIGATGKSNMSNVLSGLLQPETNQNSGQAAAFASIYTPVKIGNAFSLQVELSSGKAGRLDFGPYAGASGELAYRVTYRPGKQGSLELQRVTSQGTTAIGHYDGAIDTSNKRKHTIKLTRDRSGAMQVWLDGQKVIDAKDDRIRQPFDGILFINSSGEHWVRSVTVDGAKAG